MSEMSTAPTSQIHGPVVLISSPHAGNARSLSELAALLETYGVQVGERMTVDQLDMRRPAGPAWQAAGLTAAIAVGGDGTVGAVATHVVGSSLALGILPTGTANDVARSFGIPMATTGACAVVAAGRVREIDAGQVLPSLTKPGALSGAQACLPSGEGDAASPWSGAYFLHALSLGLNVEFARLATDASRRERLRGLTYPASALEAAAHFRPLPVTLRVLTPTYERERELELTVLTVLMLNTPVFGGAMNLRVPGVAPEDHLLDFVVIEAPEPLKVRATVEHLRQRLGHLVERHMHRSGNTEPTPIEDEAVVFSLPGIHHFQARSLLIETPEPAELTMDGEIRARTPALVRAVPNALRILVPTAASGTRLSAPAQ